MKNNNEPSSQLNEIHEMMLRSSRFISLSGLSGVSAGIIAIAGTVLAICLYGFRIPGFVPGDGDFQHVSPLVLIDAFTVLLLSFAFAVYFTTRKARKKGLKVWDSTAKRLLVNILIPLITGGFFCIALFFHNLGFMVPSATLVFYGLSLINASRYTLYEIRFLGIIEVVLGVVSSFLTLYSVFFWAAGFGLLHIIYGSYMFFKYEYIRQ